MVKQKNIIFSFLWAILLVISSAQPAQSVVTYDENIYGDFPNWLSQDPSGSLVFNVGTNSISGSTTYYYSGTPDIDAIKFTIPAGMSLSAVNISLTKSGTGIVSNYILSLYSYDASLNYTEISTWESGIPPVSNSSAFADVLTLAPGNYAIFDSSVLIGFPEQQSATLHYTIEVTVTGIPLPDSDGDGILDSFDNCLNTVNFEQTDSDTDGEGDVCDSCPLDSANDIDNDGICGNVDNFPLSTIKYADIDNSGSADLLDAILLLKISANLSTDPNPIYKMADTNNDGTLGLPEILFVLEGLAGLRAGNNSPAVTEMAGNATQVNENELFSNTFYCDDTDESLSHCFGYSDAAWLTCISAVEIPASRIRLECSGTPGFEEITGGGNPALTKEFSITVTGSDGIAPDTQMVFDRLVNSVNRVCNPTGIPDTSPLTVGELFTHTMDATDPDGDSVRHSLISPRTDVESFNRNNGALAWRPLTAGNYTIRINGTDPYGGTCETLFDKQVDP